MKTRENMENMVPVTTFNKENTEMMKAIGTAMIVLGGISMILFGAGCRGPGASVAGPAIQPATQVSAQPVYAVPRLEGLVVDGRADDWGARGFRVDAMVDSGSGRVRPAVDYDPRFRLGWNEQGLLVLAQVDDDVAEESANDSTLYERDSVELFVAIRQGEPRLLQVVAAPGTDPRYPELRCKIYSHRPNEAVKAKELPKTAVQLARTATGHGYVLEALLPWSNLDLTPKAGDEVAFQIFCNDTDGSNRTKVMWYPVDGVPWNSACMHRLRLAETPAPAVRVACNGAYERFRRTCVGVIAAGELVGHTATVVDAGHQLGSGVLAADGRRASVELTCPMPPPGEAYGPLTVLVDGVAMASVELPDPRQARADAFYSARLNFTRSVFTGAAFPACDFDQPSLAEDLVGRYSLRTDFYAADFTPATSAEKPGRYGAIVTITAGKGTVYKRFVTLFRQPERTRGEGMSLSGDVGLPKEMGIDPQVVREQAAALAGGLMQSFSRSSSVSSDPAILLAALFETKPGSAAMTRYHSAWTMDQHWWFGLKRRTGDFSLYPHMVRLPKNYEADPNARHPLILYLHGSDGSRPTVEREAKNDIAAYADAHPDFPFILVTPACRWREGWSPDDLGALLDDVAKRYRVDPDRVYLTGLSMGGFATWSLAADQPERFAAVVPICGGGDPGDAERLKAVPIWIFHGDADAAVPVAYSLDMEAALTKAGGKPRMTIYPGVDHNSWSRTYANPELYAWLMEHRLSQRAK